MAVFGRFTPLRGSIMPAKLYNGSYIGRFICAFHSKHKFSIVNQNFFSFRNISRKTGVGDVHPFVIAQAFFGGNDDFIAFAYEHATIFHIAQADFRSLQIGQNAHMCSQLIVQSAHMGYDLRMIVIATVREIDTGNAHACLYKPLQGIDG
jgi:hypothetical protein